MTAFSYEARPPRGTLWLIGLSLAVVGGGVISSAGYKAFNAGYEAFTLFTVAIPCVLIVSGYAANHWEFSRYGRVEVFDDRIVIHRNTTKGAESSVAFTTLAGFRDRSSEYVELVPREGASIVGALFLNVPTPDEETRRRLLEHLDARGLPRLE